MDVKFCPRCKTQNLPTYTHCRYCKDSLENEEIVYIDENVLPMEKYSFFNFLTFLKIVGAIIFIFSVIVMAYILYSYTWINNPFNPEEIIFVPLMLGAAICSLLVGLFGFGVLLAFSVLIEQNNELLSR